VPVLTGLAPDPHHPGYCVVELDRGRFASLPEAVVGPLALEVGQEVASDTLERLQAAADEEAAGRAALRALARRGFARIDLGRRLMQKQHPPAAVERALARLAERGLLDDRQFAEQFTTTHAARGRGPARLVSDLIRQGVERRLAEETVRATLSDEGIDAGAAARRVAVRRAAQLGDLPLPVKRRRLLAYLARRGYDGQVVRAVVEEVAALYSSG
jgi:regulatory protein